VPAGTYDVHYYIVMRNTNAAQCFWATRIAINNGAVGYSGNTVTTVYVPAGYAGNYPFTGSGYRRISFGSTSSVQVKGQIYGDATNRFLGYNTLILIKVN
jgi:hypothetical protein